MLVASRFLVTMLYLAHTVTIFLLTSVIGLIRLILWLSHLCLNQLTTTCVASPGHDIKLHPHRVKLYRIGCVGFGSVLAKVLT